MMKIKVIDLFCGAGGFTTGVENAVVDDFKVADVIACINHDPLAIVSHEKNHPGCKHYTEDITKFDEHNLPTKVDFPDDVLLLHASLECTNFSKAKGGKPRDADSRTLADHLPRYIKWAQPDIITIENVREFLSWGPLNENGKPVNKLNGRDFMKWRYAIEDLGYKYDHRFLNSANFGAHTSRERYFGIFVKHGFPIVFPEATHDKKERNGLHKWKPVKEKLDFSNEGKSIFGRAKELSDKTLERIFAGLVKYVSKGDTSFIVKYLGNDAHTGINNGKSVHEPITTISCQGRLYVAFIAKYFSGKPEGKVIPVDGPAGTIKTADCQSLIQAEFLSSYYSNGENIIGTDDALPTISTKDRFAVYFIQKQYNSNLNHQSIEQPAGTIMQNDKHSLIECEKFLVDQSFGNSSFSLDRPAPTILACRKNHYLVNPQYNNVGASIEDPAPVIIARQDKKPMGMVTTEHGDEAVILVFEDDTEAMKKIKYFMAEYGIIDIKMRMLTVMELKTITGFPPEYYLAGAQQHQKKFIGNAVTPIIPKLWMEALWKELVQVKMKAA